MGSEERRVTGTGLLLTTQLPGRGRAASPVKRLIDFRCDFMCFDHSVIKITARRHYCEPSSGCCCCCCCRAKAYRFIFSVCIIDERSKYLRTDFYFRGKCFDKEQQPLLLFNDVIFVKLQKAITAVCVNIPGSPFT